MTLHRLGRRWWPLHPHLVRISDMALGPREHSWRAAVAWRWRCLLCGREIVESFGRLPDGSEWMCPKETT
jgi:hypothetical protein